MVLATGEIFEVFEFIVQHPNVLWDLITFGIAGTVNQFFIFIMISSFGPLPCAITTTLRKLFSVVLSTAVFGNSTSPIQWILRWIFWNCDKCATNVINRLGRSCTCAYVVVVDWASSSKKQMSTEIKMVNNNWTPANSVNNSSDLLLHFSCLLTILQFNVLSNSLIHSKKCQSQSHYLTSNDVQNPLFQS